MATEKRAAGPSINERLFAEWYRFSFFSAVHLLESLTPEKKKLGANLDPSGRRYALPSNLGSPFQPATLPT